MWHQIVDISSDSHRSFQDTFHTCASGISWGHYSLDCLSGLNSFIPCVCTVTYLSFSKIQTTNGYLLQEAWQLFVTHMYHINNTGLHGTFHGIHRSRETGCDKRGVIVHSSIPLFPMCWAVVKINVELAQARPNNLMTFINTLTIISQINLNHLQLVLKRAKHLFELRRIILFCIQTCIWNSM